MTEARKLQLTLDEVEAKVVAAGLAVLPLILDNDVLGKLLDAVDEHEHRLLIVMTAALMAGAEKTATMQKEMTDAKLTANIRRGAQLTSRLHEWLQEGRPSGHSN